MTLHNALVDIFGSEPEQIHASSLEHLTVTLNQVTVAHLMAAGGPRWQAVLDGIAERTEERKRAKSAFDGRLSMEEKKS